jgi:hypothetical protein
MVLLPHMNLSDLQQLKDIAAILSDAASFLAITAAAWWFLATTRFKPRIQFELDCQFFEIEASPDNVVAELQFIFENKGFVEHRLYNLLVSVHALGESSGVSERAETRELLFKEQILQKVSIVPKKFGYYFVRPGARQVITHIITVPKKHGIIRVTAGFEYHRGDRYPHTARRVFEIKPGVKSEG